MDTLRQDLAYASRRLRQSPGFSLVAVATLALGIGAVSAIFSIANAVLLKPLPFPEPGRLVRVAQVWKERPVVCSPQNFLDIAGAARSFESLAAVDGGSTTLTSGGAPERVEGAEVSASFFDVLGVKPELGRGFVAGENEPGRSKLAVLGRALWTRRFGADPTLVGRTIDVDRQPYLVVGVAPAGFSYPEGAEIWTPMEYDVRFRSKSRGAWYLDVVGRLKPGVSVAAAASEVSTIAARLAREYPDDDAGLGGTALSLQEALVGRSRPALLLLLGAVGLVLMIACVNVANLLLARVAAREAELAVRSALGAARGRLLRQLVTESLLLAALGGAAGVLLARLSLDSLLRLAPAGLPRLAEVSVDQRVMLFAAGLSLASGLLFGVFPALHSTARPAAQALREGGRGILTRRGGRLRSGLIVGQLALAMVLLAGAGLLVRSFLRLRGVDPGFTVTNALTFRISLPDAAYQQEPRREAFFEELTSRLGALPGVQAVGAVQALPLTGAHFEISFEVKGRPPLPPAQQPSMQVRVATPGYFKTIGIPLVKGRLFDAADGASAPQVALLSAAAVRRFFPREDPIGHWITLGWGRGEGRSTVGGQVVGVVGDVKEAGLAEADPPEIYVPHAQMPIHSMDVVMRTALSPESLAPSAARIVHGLDPELPVARTQTLAALVSRSVAQPRFYMLLLAAFAATALSLAALGIFGVMSYVVLQRSREIGIRVALGAHQRDVLRLVLGHALLLAGLGVAAGLVGALALARTLSGLLFALSPSDPPTLVAVALLLSAVALLASYLPARRAARADPLTALRSE
jgi:putative ABC transport system permease protein